MFNGKKCLSVLHVKLWLVWQNDFDTEDVGQEDSEFLIVSMYQCPENDCCAWYEVYHGKKEGDKSIN
jgi:hypothetical protein